MKTGSKYLTAGLHSAFVEGFEDGGYYRFSLEIEGPGLPKMLLKPATIT